MPGRGPGDVDVVPDDGHAAGQVIAGHDFGQRVVDGGVGLGAGTCAGQCDEKENGIDDSDAH